MMLSGPKPSNMNEICRLCLADDGNKSPIFGDEDDLDHAEIPLSFRIMACVSVEVSLSDGLPNLICQGCLDNVNSWHEFKQVCDTAQTKLKEWQDSMQVEEDDSNKEGEEPVATASPVPSPSPVSCSPVSCSPVSCSPVSCSPVHSPSAVPSPSMDLSPSAVLNSSAPPSPIAVPSPDAIPSPDAVPSVAVISPVAVPSPATVPSPVTVPSPLAVPSPSAAPAFNGVPSLNAGPGENDGEKNMVPQEIIIKQEPVEPVEEVEEVCDSTQSEHENFTVDYIKQEESEAEEPQEPEVMCDESGDPLGLTVESATSLLPREDIDEHAESNCIGELKISNIKTECEDIIDIDDDDEEVDMTDQIGDGHLLRSVLQGKAKMTMYSRKIAVGFDSGLGAFGVKPFTCNICNKSFSYNYLLKRHEKIHKAERNMCVYCHKSYTSHTDLLTHVNHYVAGLPKPYTCDHCQQEFPCRSSYSVHNCPSLVGNQRESHGMREAGENNFQCFICLSTFASQLLVRIHMRKDHQHFSCHKCNKLFSNGVALSNHLRGHCTGSGKKKCDMCPKSFPTMSLLLRHKKSHMRALTRVPKIRHRNEIKVQIPPPVIAPVKREPVSPPQEHELEAVEELAGKEESDRLERRNGPHLCSVCRETFTSQAALRFHLKGIHMQYHCHRCPKVYTSGVALSNHLRSHNLQGGIKRHRCLTCLKTFHNLDLLTKHKKIHSKPSMETRQTRMQEALAQGLLAGESSQIGSVDDRTCNICSLVAASRSALERHMACHMKEKMYTCHVCQLSMGYASSLQKHLRVAHGIVVELKSIQKNEEIVDDENETVNEIKMEVGEDFPIINEDPGNVLELNVVEDEEGEVATTPEETTTNDLEMNEDVQPVDNSGLPFECKTCHNRFQYRSVLLRHLKVHKLNCAKNVPVACPICMKPFTDLKTLNNHKGVHTRFKHYPCHTCGKSFNGLNAWQKHQRMHQKGFIYSCKLCGKKFISKADLHEHKKMHIKLKIYTCGVCKNSYHSSSALSKHKRKNGHYASTVENEIEIDNPELELSDDAFSEVEMLTNEMMPGEKEDEELELEEEETQQLQPQQQQQQQQQLPPEPISFAEGFYPSGRRRPTCSICNRIFTRYSALKRHRRLHLRGQYIAPPAPVITGETKDVEVEERLENTCPVCNRTFSDHASLVRHKGWHTRRSGLGLPPIPLSQLPVATSVAPAPVDTADPDGALEEARTPPPVKAELASPSKSGHLCPHCHKTFATPAALANHVKVHENHPKLYACTKCPKSFSTNAALANHVKIHVFYCAKCERNFSTSSALANHLKSHSDRTPSSDGLRDSVNEEQELDQSPQRRLACKICRKPFESKKALITHIGWHSRTSYSKKLMINPWKKPGTPLTPAVVASAFPQPQIENEKVEESYSCDVCQKVFSSMMSLTRHKKLHTRHLLSSIKMKPEASTVPLTVGSKIRFPCNVCSRVFKLKRYLDIHMEVHNGDRRFKCNQCPQAYTTSGSLWKHKRTQHAFKLFSCPICQMRFGIKSQLMQHMKSHDITEEFLNSNQNLYSCGICSKAFGRLDRLRQHEKSHQV